jgi:hypothetical protein
VGIVWKKSRIFLVVEKNEFDFIDRKFTKKFTKDKQKVIEKEFIEELKRISVRRCV